MTDHARSTMPSTLVVAVVGMLALVSFGCADAGAKNVKTSAIGSAPGAFDGLKLSPVKLFDGSGAFREIRFTVTGRTTASGTKAKKLFEGCALLALAAAEHAQGMMQRTNFAGYDAMIFHFDAPSDGGFWMKTVPMDLSIAWTDDTGAVVAKYQVTPGFKFTRDIANAWAQGGFEEPSKR